MYSVCWVHHQTPLTLRTGKGDQEESEQQKSGVKKMAVGHHHGECSHTIEQKSKLALKGEGGEAGLCQLGIRWVRVGLHGTREWGWVFRSGD